MSSMDKTVSVVMATYNGQEFIQEQIDSIIAQTYPIHELIIQDDCSTDSTVAICREYEQRYPFVHVYVNDRNLGFSDNFHSVVMKATGGLVAISDQDDVWFPQKIERQVQAIGEHTMCYSLHMRGTSQENSRMVDYKNAPERHMFKAVVGHSMLLRRDFVQDSSSWPGILAYDIWLTMLANFRNGIVHIPEPLNWHRTHDGQASENTSGRKPSAWKPYIYGISDYFHLKKTSGWLLFYTRILQESQDRNPLVHRMSQLMLSRNPLSLISLCILCHRHRATVYPSDRTTGLMGHIRSFFYPLIHAYYATDFYGQSR